MSGAAICGVWLLLTVVVWAVCSAIAKYMKSPEYQAWIKAEEARQKEAAIQSDKKAARQHLIAFYNAHPELAEIVPSWLIIAFIRAAMPDTLDGTRLWEICHEKIAELQPLVAQERQAQEDSCLEARVARLRAEYERRVAALRTLANSLDPESREAIELDRLIEEATTRLKTELQKICQA
jgi:hypothetical protein